MTKKNLIWALAFLALCAVCAAVIFVQRQDRSETDIQKTAQLYIGDELIREINLSEDFEPYEFDIKTENGTNRIRAEHGRIAVVSADCPDKLCVNQGWSDASYKPIVCLPHKLTIKVETKGETEEFDAAAGIGGSIEK